ncbi:NIPSNAP family protein [Flavobacterium sp. MDT1-60]|uniref:NIPSNAP family protein n=1 Tax=Flavobacterium sp. MDT1-60 TaxID=1979344 RepID=UPI0017849C8A|nr:NIPSNAP family protein [Flavobacterium sp. MDT1-60]QOG00996.1 NIPSNAP family protein [Flavobacterium sp. MDT1-60]
MITCHLKYVIDPYQLEAFEDYGKRWIKIVNRLGGKHHGYFMPSEGANNIAYALFSFPSLSDYENYRKKMFSKDDQECVEAFKIAENTRCIISYERTFLSPVFE